MIPITASPKPATSPLEAFTLSMAMIAITHAATVGVKNTGMASHSSGIRWAMRIPNGGPATPTTNAATARRSPGAWG